MFRLWECVCPLPALTVTHMHVACGLCCSKVVSTQRAASTDVVIRHVQWLQVTAGDTKWADPVLIFFFFKFEESDLSSYQWPWRIPLTETWHNSDYIKGNSGNHSLECLLVSVTISVGLFISFIAFIHPSVSVAE